MKEDERKAMIERVDRIEYVISVIKSGIAEHQMHIDKLIENENVLIAESDALIQKIKEMDKEYDPRSWIDRAVYKGRD